MAVRDSVAQLVEHATFNRLVLGSSPSGITSLLTTGGEEVSFIDAHQSIVLHAVHSDGAFLFWGERVDPSQVPPPRSHLEGGEAEVDTETMPDIDVAEEVDESPSGPSSPETATATVTNPIASTSTTSPHPFATDAASIASLLGNVLEADPELEVASGDDEGSEPAVDLSSQATELRLLLPHRTDHEHLPAPSLALGSLLGFKTPEPEDLRLQATMVPAIKVTPLQASNILSIIGSTTESTVGSDAGCSRSRNRTSVKTKNTTASTPATIMKAETPKRRVSTLVTPGTSTAPLDQTRISVADRLRYSSG